MLTKETINLIKKIYDLKNPILECKVAEGVLSENFVLNDCGKKYFLKKYNKRRKEKVFQIHSVKGFLFSNGIPVVIPITTQKGKTFFELDDNFYALFPFVEGVVRKRWHFNKSALISAAETLAKIHLLSKNGAPSLAPVKNWGPENKNEHLKELILEKVGLKKKDDFDYLALETIKIKEKVEAKLKGRVRDYSFEYNHLIHGDYHDGNIFFDSKGKVKYIFDLEKTSISPRVWEIVRSLEFICISKDFTERDFESARLYLKAYRGLYPISHTELRKGLENFIYRKASDFWVEEEYYLNDNKRPSKFLSLQYQKLLYYNDHLDEIIEKILK